MTDQPPADNPWNSPAFAQAWNETFGMEMERAPTRAGLVYPLFEQHMGDLEGRTLADFGCGNGNLIARFRDRPFKKWHAYDNGKAILATARKNISDPRVRFTQIDLSGSNLVLPRVDILTSTFVLEEVPNARLQDFFRNAARSLAPGGAALFFTNHPAYAMVEAQAAERLDVPNIKFEGHRGYFDTDPSTYAFSAPGMAGAPLRAAYHHKPMGRIFNTAAAAGLALESMIEIPRGIVTVDALRAHVPAPGDFPRFMFLRFSLR